MNALAEAKKTDQLEVVNPYDQKLIETDGHRSTASFRLLIKITPSIAISKSMPAT